MHSNIRFVVRHNLYFFLPFLIWVIGGACCLFLFTKSELFFAFNSFHNSFLDQLNTVFSAFGRGDMISFILTSLLSIPVFRNWNYILTCLGFGLLFPLLIYVSKIYFNFPRPLTYYKGQNVHTVPWLDNLYWQSFPSGHTFGAFGFFLLLSLYIPSKFKPWSLFFFLMALACGYSRIYLGQHFFLDVYVGSIAGTLLALLIYLAGQKLFSTSSSKNDLSHA